MVVGVRRAAVRPSINLQQDRVSAGYRNRIGKAGALFVCWAGNQGIEPRLLAQLPENVPELNRLLVGFAQHCWDTGKAEWTARYAILWFQLHFRSLKGHLRLAWDSLFSCKALEGVRSRVPMRIEIVGALSYFSVLAGCFLDPQNFLDWIAFGVAIRTAFAGLLRPAELFSLRRKSVLLPSRLAFRFLDVGVLSIEEPKNKASGASRQVRLVRDRSALQWLVWYATNLPMEGPLWPFGAARFNTLLKDALRFYALNGLGLTAGSLRAGGATHLLEIGVSVGEIKFLGGWSAERMLCHYLQTAESAATLLALSPTQASRLSGGLDLLGFLEAPPKISVTQLRKAWTAISQGSR